MQTITVSSTLPCMWSVKPELKNFVVPFENQLPLSFGQWYFNPCTRAMCGNISTE